MALLSEIPADVLKQYILPQLDSKTLKKFLKSNKLLANNVEGYQDDRLYWKRRMEYLVKMDLGPDDIVEGGYNVDWKLIHDRVVGDKEPDWESLIYIKFKEDNPDYIDLAMDMGVDISASQFMHTFERAAEHGYIKIMNKFLQDSRFVPRLNYDELDSAAANNHWDIIIRLMEDDRINKTDIFKVAAKYHRDDIVNDLLKSDKLDLSAAFVSSARYGYYDIVVNLINDPQVNPAVQDNAAIISAAANGHTDIVNLLVKDDRVNPADNSNVAILTAAQYGYLDIVNILLQDPRVNPAVSANSGDALNMATIQGHLNVVKRLVEDKRINPLISGRETIIAAAKYNHPDIVTFILEKGWFSIRLFNSALEIAGKRNYLEVVRNLLQYASNNPDMNISPIILSGLIPDKSFWLEYIKKYYGVAPSNLDTINKYNIVSVYQALESIDKTISTYTPNNFKETRNELGELLSSTIRNKIYTVFKYAIKRGAPITYKKGSIFSKAIVIWGLDALELISSVRLTNYMRDRTRALNFVNAIVKYARENSVKVQITVGSVESVYEGTSRFLIDYLFRNDKREPKKDSNSYNILRSKYNSNEMKEYFDRNIL